VIASLVLAASLVGQYVLVPVQQPSYAPVAVQYAQPSYAPAQYGQQSYAVMAPAAVQYAQPYAAQYAAQYAYQAPAYAGVAAQVYSVQPMLTPGVGYFPARMHYRARYRSHLVLFP
jgi:hypothetical protein